MSGFNLGDYKEVADRIPEFYEKHPDGRIAAIGEPKVVTVGNKHFIGVTVGVWRTPDDPQPCIASAWEPFPGDTPYTRDSEMMNAETSAWGRALVAAGILAKGERIASRNEVRNRSAEKIAATREEPRKEAGTVPAPHTNQPDSGAPSPASTLERARQYAKPNGNGYSLEDAVCPSCGKKEALGPKGAFCAKAKGGCGWPLGKGEKGVPISYGEWLERAEQKGLAL